MSFDLIEFVCNIRSHTDRIVRSGAEIPVYRKKEVVLEHALDDVVRRAYDVVVLVAELDLREHGLVDVEGLVDDFDLFPGLFLVPVLKFSEQFFVYIVSPVIYLEYIAALVRTAAGKQKYCRSKANNLLDHLYSALLELRIFLRLITISRRSIPRNIIVIIGLSSGVSPPFLASV